MDMIDVRWLGAETRNATAPRPRYVWGPRKTFVFWGGSGIWVVLSFFPDLANFLFPDKVCTDGAGPSLEASVLLFSDVVAEFSVEHCVVLDEASDFPVFWTATSAPVSEL